MSERTGIFRGQGLQQPPICRPSGLRRCGEVIAHLDLMDLVLGQIACQPDGAEAVTVPDPSAADADAIQGDDTRRDIVIDVQGSLPSLTRTLCPEAMRCGGCMLTQAETMIDNGVPRPDPGNFSALPAPPAAP